MASCHRLRLPIPTMDVVSLPSDFNPTIMQMPETADQDYRDYHPQVVFEINAIKVAATNFQEDWLTESE